MHCPRVFFSPPFLFNTRHTESLPIFFFPLDSMTFIGKSNEFRIAALLCVYIHSASLKNVCISKFIKYITAAVAGGGGVVVVAVIRFLYSTNVPSTLAECLSMNYPGNGRIGKKATLQNPF